MARILFFVFLAFLVWLAVRVLGGSRRRPESVAPDEAVPPGRRGPGGDGAHDGLLDGGQAVADLP